ncbi:hypothetical protein Smp_155730 [Schistosoma mansoni]|uniref:hypothetical protein n=1 Tax=Schistosoma mansoni TaxID=6183 RepID=UPI00022DC435|nr:hypothetical protein Smp_155730 [Schistosoma mansoni]|eukprot:XP_018652103.1 hypothetical protein Smp_155730 [Schistosoma mansoni]
MKLLNFMCIAILYRTISFGFKSTDEADEYFYSNILYDIPIQYQYLMRAGYSPGHFGTEQNPIIIPPESHGKTLLDFNTHSNEDYTNSSTSTSARKFQLIVRQDIHQFCPKACAYRGGPGFNVKHKTELNRYTSLCNFPKHFMTVSSQRCIEQNNVGLVNLQSFKCDCSNGFIWKEQLKACYLPYGWSQKAERTKRIIDTKRSDQFIYYAQNNCSRIGTKFVQPIEISTRNSNQPNYDKLHHTERCICKDEFYGTNCNQVFPINY